MQDFGGPNDFVIVLGQFLNGSGSTSLFLVLGP